VAPNTGSIVPITTRVLQSPAALEIYIMALPSPSASVEAQAKEAYGAVRDRLRDGKARIFEERVFASEAALKAACKSVFAQPTP